MSPPALLNMPDPQASLSTCFTPGGSHTFRNMTWTGKCNLLVQIQTIIFEACKSFRFYFKCSLPSEMHLFTCFFSHIVFQTLIDTQCSSRGRSGWRLWLWSGSPRQWGSGRQSLDSRSRSLWWIPHHLSGTGCLTSAGSPLCTHSPPRNNRDLFK